MELMDISFDVIGDNTVDMVNGKWLSGTKRVIKGYFRNNKENKKYEKQLEGKEKRE